MIFLHMQRTDRSSTASACRPSSSLKFASTWLLNSSKLLGRSGFLGLPRFLTCCVRSSTFLFSVSLGPFNLLLKDSFTVVLGSN